MKTTFVEASRATTTHRLLPHPKPPKGGPKSAGTQGGKHELHAKAGLPEVQAAGQ
jgi:hypothetical protein